ncbi:hypothetical protein C0J50_21830 [Silurus asotus]|uniref:Uncharacterized protein n=1 Tax=Silurus asotus TaxID=30991 RepID=A0AAD5ALY6_SILAS|nr:hypothetical protein C0J50_21830 [Silurus asotus]
MVATLASFCSGNQLLRESTVSIFSRVASGAKGRAEGMETGESSPASPAGSSSRSPGKALASAVPSSGTCNAELCISSYEEGEFLDASEPTDTLQPVLFEELLESHTEGIKGYLTKKESDGVLRQMTWPPQSPDLNPIEMV